MRRRVLRALTQDKTSFIIEVDTTKAGSSSSDQFTIPTTGTGYNYTVKTSDGQALTGRTGNTTITFPSSGIYEVKISGDFPRIYFNNTGDRLKLIDIKQWGNIQCGNSLTRAFYGCENMEMSATDAPDLSNTTIISEIFRNCDKFNTNINHWDVSNIVIADGVFYQTAIYNQPLDQWDVSNFENITNFFNEALSFNQSLNSWNTASLKECNAVFKGGIYNQPLDNWIMDSVTTIREMFYLNTSFNQDISSWNLMSLQNMQSALHAATAFNQDISDWNVSNVTVGTNFMQSKSAANYNATYLDNIYNKWSLLSVQPNVTISFGSIKYTAAGSAGKAILQGSPNNWTIADGGI